MQCIEMHEAYEDFYFILKKHLKLRQKVDFPAHFERFLVYTLFVVSFISEVFVVVEL